MISRPAQCCATMFILKARKTNSDHVVLSLILCVFKHSNNITIQKQFTKLKNEYKSKQKVQAKR